MSRTRYTKPTTTVISAEAVSICAGSDVNIPIGGVDPKPGPKSAGNGNAVSYDGGFADDGYTEQ